MLNTSVDWEALKEPPLDPRLPLESNARKGKQRTRENFCTYCNFFTDVAYLQDGLPLSQHGQQVR